MTSWRESWRVLAPSPRALAAGVAVLSVAALAFPEAALWFGLGVLATAGFGFGVQTGPLKLFPLACARGAAHGSSMAQAWTELFWPAFWWGTGCAVGEIPPFLLSSVGSGLVQGILAALPKAAPTARCTNLLKRRAWLFVFLNACWPNAAFDACGVLAGAMGTSFPVFFSATWCGKTLVKTLLLEMPFFIAVCSGRVPGLKPVVDAVAPWLSTGGMLVAGLLLLWNCWPSCRNKSRTKNETHEPKSPDPGAS